MHRVDDPGHVANRFTAGDPGVPQVATVLGADWHNSVQEEICNAVEGAGLALNKAVENQLAQALNYLARASSPGGRLTVVSGDPVGEAAAAGTIYYTPFRSDWIQLYDGTSWLWRLFAERSQLLSDATKSPAAAVAAKNYDMFLWLDSGTVRCTRGPAWATDTTRGVGAATTELELFGGRWVNKYAVTNGPLARRGLYVGSIRTDAGGATVTDGGSFANVSNTYNQVSRVRSRVEGGAPWVYTSPVFQQANANAANQIEYLHGLPGGVVLAEVLAHAQNTVAGTRIWAGLGLDSLVENAAYWRANTAHGAGYVVPAGALWEGSLGIGRHFVAWLEASGAAGVTTWYGSPEKSGLRLRTLA